MRKGTNFSFLCELSLGGVECIWPTMDCMKDHRVVELLIFSISLAPAEGHAWLGRHPRLII